MVYTGLLNIKCLDPSFAMKKLENICPYSIIVAS